MFKLLSLEWKKFHKNSVVQMLVWIFIIFFPSLIFIGKSADFDDLPMLSSEDIFAFPGIWDWLGYDGSWMVFFCFGFLMVYMITIEVSYKTLRQNIITGLTRTEFFMAKFYVMLGFSILATVLYAIFGLAIGWFHTEDATMAMAFDNNWAIPRFFLMCLSYLSFAMFIGFMIKESGLAVLTYLSYGILVEPLIRRLGHSELTNGHESMNWYPLNAAEDLMPIPFPDFMNGVTGQLYLPMQTAVGLSIFYTLLFLGITYYSFTKKDI